MKPVSNLNKHAVAHSQAPGLATAHPSRRHAGGDANVGADGQGIAPMKRYASAAGDSGVAAYECGPDSITIRFHHGGTYRYDGRHPGSEHVIEMQRLAEAGVGLNTYINQYVREDYAARLD